jgi:hypothetical protein
MLWLVALAAGVVVGLLSGGSVGNLSRLQFRWPWLVIAAVVVREAVLLTPLNRIEGARYVYVLSLVAIVAWTIAHLRRLPAVWLVTIGAALNLLVILVNGGRMPVTPGMAMELLSRGQIGQYVIMSPDTQLNGLADWIAFPPIPEAYSPGDIVIALGVALIVFLAARPKNDRNPAAYSGLTPP